MRSRDTFTIICLPHRSKIQLRQLKIKLQIQPIILQTSWNKPQIRLKSMCLTRTRPLRTWKNGVTATTGTCTSGPTTIRTTRATMTPTTLTTRFTPSQCPESKASRPSAADSLRVTVMAMCTALRRPGCGQICTRCATFKSQIEQTTHQPSTCRASGTTSREWLSCRLSIRIARIPISSTMAGSTAPLKIYSSRSSLLGFSICLARRTPSTCRSCTSIRRAILRQSAFKNTSMHMRNTCLDT